MIHHTKHHITNKPTHQNNTGVADSGATRHFLIESKGHKNIKTLSSPIPITILDSGTIYATQTCELDYHELPHKDRIAYIVPEMKNYSLISIKQLCDAGCQVLFQQKDCTVFFNNKIIMRGIEDPKKKLWKLPLSTSSNNIYDTEK